MRVAVLFDGAGLARLGLEQAGHICTGYELDPSKHHLSLFLGSGNCILQDVRTVDLTPFDAIWASPPCQERSGARTQGKPVSKYADNLLTWSLSLVDRYPDKVIWVENVLSRFDTCLWGKLYNAAQFTKKPLQCRQRMVGGRHKPPHFHRIYRRVYPGSSLCPAITATEYKGCATDKRRASRFYGRRLTLEECAYHQGLNIPGEWYIPMQGYTAIQWRNNLYEAIGNGVPVYMAYSFGSAYTLPYKVYWKG